MNIEINIHKEEIISQYNSEKSINFIANKYGVSSSLISNRLKLWNVLIRDSGWKYRNYPDIANKYTKKYERLSDFFGNINNISSYWAGFIAADGNITKSNSVKISLGIKDLYHLSKLKNDLMYEGPIRLYKNNYNREYCVLDVYDTKLVSDLSNIWGITKSKTFSVVGPNLDDNNYSMSYIAGYIDGDGTISYLTRTRNPYISIMCNYNMGTWIQNVLSNVLNYSVGHINKSKSIYRLGIYRGSHVEDIYNIVSKLSLPLMHRKWDILRDYKFIDRRNRLLYDD